MYMQVLEKGVVGACGVVRPETISLCGCGVKNIS